jgi:oligoribonuclease NrnB/cAMP/cGMP phosphodiesterase (DHH superfamily)
METLRNIKDDIDCVIYHDPCQDGFSAAWVAYHYNMDRLNKKIKLIPKRINNDPIDEELYIGKNVLMVDIVTDDFLLIKSKAKNLVILDHHKTNQEKLAGVEFAHFDMTKSGVGLAWEYFFEGEEIPKFLACIQDRDLWTWKIPESKAFCDGFYNLMYLDDIEDYESRIQFRLKLFDELYFEKYEMKTTKFDSYCQIGDVLDKIKMSKIKSMVRNLDLYEVELENFPKMKMAIFNCTHDIASDLGSYAVEHTEADFAVMWRFSHENDEYYYSLRSKDHKADVSKICKLFGGGGHRNASGCASKLHPKELFKYTEIDEE